MKTNSITEKNRRSIPQILMWACVFTILCIFTPVLNVEAANDGVSRAINSVLAKYPDGSYFSSTGGPCGPGQTNFGYGNYCTFCQLYIMDSSASAVCGNGDSCNAFAKYVFYKVFGLAPYNCPSSTSTNLNNIAKVGDFVACYNSSNLSGTPSHYLIYMGSAGGTAFYAYEANVGTENLVRYRFLHCSDYGNLWGSYKVYHASNYDKINGTLADSTQPTISNVTVSDITKDGYTVKCTVSDNVGITQVKFPSWNTDKHKGGDANWLTGTISGGTATCRINISQLKSGAVEGNYVTHIYAYDAAGNTTSVSTNNIYIDRTPPVITDVKVIERDSNGYLVQCKVTDNKKINRVQCPTWTVNKDQDDIASDWANNTAVKATNKGNGIYQFRVNISDHNYENGLYRTHIYAYDECGNYASVNVGDVEICSMSLGTNSLDGASSSTPSGKNAFVGYAELRSKYEKKYVSRKIITTAYKNGEEIKNEIDLGAATIAAENNAGAFFAVNRKDFDYAEGAYTTSFIFEEENGTIWTKSMTYDFDQFKDDIQITIKKGEVYELSQNAVINDCLNKGYRIVNMLAKQSVNSTIGDIKIDSDNRTIKAVSSGRVYVSLANIVVSLDSKLVIIDVVDSDKDNNQEVSTTEQLDTEEPKTEELTSPDVPSSEEQKTSTGTSGNKVKIPTVSKVKFFKAKEGKKKLTLSWKKISGVAGYQIQISTKKNFKGSKIKSISKSKKSYTAKKLKAKKKYYVRIRAYKKYINAQGKTKKVYGKWVTINKKTK